MQRECPHLDDQRAFRYCGNNGGRFWQADHIVALVLCDPNDLEKWSLSNIRTLCTECHRQKTTADVRQHRSRTKPPEPLPQPSLFGCA